MREYIVKGKMKKAESHLFAKQQAVITSHSQSHTQIKDAL
jgi:hypothetical protein